MSQPMSRRQVAAVVGLMIAVRAAVLIGMISLLPEGPNAYNRVSYDAARYHRIAGTPGRPYRDFPVEVPPVELGAIEVLDGATPKATAVRLGWAMLAMDLLIAAALWTAWGRRAGLAYLALGTPLVFLVYFRLDLISVALATVAASLAHRNKDRSAGLALAVSVLAKVWPAVLLPLWLVRRRWRAIAWSVAGLALGTAAWVWWSGWSGPFQVATFRHARGWHVQSVVGNVVDILSRARAVIEQGADRVGSAPPWAKGLLLAGLVICSSVIWIRASRRSEHATGLGSLSAVAALLVFSPLLSEQYVFWLFPWAAIAASERGWNVMLPTFLVSVATAAIGLLPGLFPPGLEAMIGPALVLVRNAFLVLVLVDGLRRLQRKDVGAEPEGPALGAPDLALEIRL
ncbi:MAG TPA: glycosyltransferase family 87 protein [Actinomycetota bacterium]